MTAEKLHDALNLLPGDLIAATDKVRSQPRKANIHWARWASLAACLAVFVYGGWLLSSGYFSGKGADTAMQMEGATCAAPAAAAPEAAAPENQAAGTIIGGAENAAEEEADRELSKDAPAESGEDCAPAETMASGSEEPDCAFPTAPSVWKNAATQYVLTPLNPSSAVNQSAEPRTILIRSREELEEYCEENQSQYDLESFRAGLFLYDDAWFAENDLLLISREVPAAEDDSCYLGPEVTGLTQAEDGSWYLSMSSFLSPDMDGTGKTVCCHILVDVQKDVIRPEDTIMFIFE